MEVIAVAKNTTQKKRKGQSVQDLIGIKTFTKYGLETNKGELLFYQVAPTNISVLSYANIEIVCTDSSECFDDNKVFLHNRYDEETNPKVRKIIKKDIEFLDQIQMEMATARQFLFIARCKKMKPSQVFRTANSIEQTITEQGFETHRLKKDEIKRFLALYFDASMNGEQMPDVDGEQYFEVTDNDEED